MAAIAQKRINILPVKRRYKTQVDLKDVGFKYGVPLLGFCVFAYAAFTFFPYAKKVTELNSTIREKQSELKKLEMGDASYELEKKKMDTEIEELTAKNDALKGNIQALKKEIDDKIFWEDILAELARSMPDHVWIGNISRQQNCLIIKGFTHSDSLIGALMARLDKSPLFSDTQFVSSEKITESDKEEIVVYELKCDIVKNPGKE